MDLAPSDSVSQVGVLTGSNTPTVVKSFGANTGGSTVGSSFMLVEPEEVRSERDLQGLLTRSCVTSSADRPTTCAPT